MGSCQASVSPASAMRSTPLTIITAATKRSTERMGLVRFVVTAAAKCRAQSALSGYPYDPSQAEQGARDTTHAEPDEPDRSRRIHLKCRPFVVGGGCSGAHGARLDPLV